MITPTNRSPSCNKEGSVMELYLSGAGLQGKLDNLSFRSFLILLCPNLSLNSQVGTIPEDISTCSKLTLLDLYGKSLSGVVPPLSNFSNMNILTLAGNQINGPIPSELGMMFLAILIVVIVFLIRHNWKHEQAKVKEEIHGNIFLLWNFDGRIAYEDIVATTEDFNPINCVGTRGYGAVYKVVLAKGHVVAVKKLYSLEVEELEDESSFNNEIRVLMGIKHRNIVKLYGFCSHPRCMFLICVANALSYLHHDCIPPIVHRDILSSNILLDSELEALVSDFRVARQLKPDSSN
ncbi:hypothetical protein NE237_019861 [Protea cynaroides]|uniref:non-specific serine/threonine protein kinase n=1 Tax=Protea cynaroides TaxID=273540 RepID=A0A9Q0H7B8_9MAGN|nr:hypothetical protein NE237_019861 [Protea cynaroides]